MHYNSPTFACSVVDDIVIGVHSNDDPTTDDWDAYINTGRAILQASGRVRILAYSRGGRPNSIQRQQANEMFENQPQKVAVMYESVVARGAITALSWFNPHIQAFRLREFNAACMHLELSQLQIAQVRTVLDQLESAMRSAQTA